MAAARGMAIPPADEVPPELEYRLTKKATSDNNKDKSIQNLTIPIGPRSQSFQSDSSSVPVSPFPNSLPLPAPSSPQPSSSPSTNIFRTRAKTLASLTTSSRSNSQADMTPREFQLPPDPFVNGQPIEVYLYKDAAECPICFLYYPPYLNTTRCCEQAICSECFVQIKRPDPHPPEHEQPDPNAPPVSEAEREAQAEGLLVSEVATCPYCKTPEFGITYTPPPFRRGLTYGTGSQPYQVMSARSSQTSISSGTLSPGPGRRRGTSLSASAPEVITTDKIRPDWATKLASARAHAARRAAAATALHTAAYLMNGQNNTEPRAFSTFGRRNMLRRTTMEGAEPSPNSSLSALALLAERHASRQQEATPTEARANPFLPPPRGSSSRRSRMDDLEDMMMMEAIRLSLASEEERRKREEKDARKEAKKKEKETKKAEKVARKSGLFTMNSNTSVGDSATSLMERSRSNLSLGADDDSVSGKGKSVERGGGIPMERSLTDEENARPSQSYLPTLSLSGTSQESLASSIPVPVPAEPFRRSHLRQMSNASSASSSFVESGPATFSGTGTPPPGSLEPMFNFQSLAAMIGEEEKGDGSAHVENAGSDRDSSPSSLDVPEKAQSSSKLPKKTENEDSSSDASLEPASRKNSAEESPSKQAEVRLENTGTAREV